MKKTYNRGNVGPLIASIVIIAILLISGIYTMKERPLKVETPLVADMEVQRLETQSTSTEIIDIDKDISDTKLDNLNSDLNSIDAEL